MHVNRKSQQDEMAAKFLITNSHGPLRRDIMSKNLTFDVIQVSVFS